MKKIIKTILSLIIIVSFGLMLCGCGKSAQVGMAKELSGSLDNLKATLQNIEDISSSELRTSINTLSERDSTQSVNNTRVANTQNIIPDDMRTPARRQIVRRTATSPNNSNGYQEGSYYDINNYYCPDCNNPAKTYGVNDCEDAICTNDKLNSSKRQILELCDIISTLSKQIKKKNISCTDEQITAINELTSNLSLNTNRISLSKNEVNNELYKVKTAINKTSTSQELIGAKYVRLKSCLDTRLTYYTNCLNLLTKIRNILTNNDNCKNGNCLYEDQSTNQATDYYADRTKVEYPRTNYNNTNYGIMQTNNQQDNVYDENNEQNNNKNIDTYKDDTFNKNINSYKRANQNPLLFIVTRKYFYNPIKTLMPTKTTDTNIVLEPDNETTDTILSKIG